MEIYKLPKKVKILPSKNSMRHKGTERETPKQNQGNNA